MYFFTSNLNLNQVFQRRQDDTQSFYQNWVSYRDGFGDLNNNFWLGNEKLYHLTKQKAYELRLDITTSDGTPLYAEYTEFEIESESTNYTMNKLGARSTTAGSAGLFYLFIYFVFYCHIAKSWPGKKYDLFKFLILMVK